MEQFRDKFLIEKYMIKEFSYWQVSLRPIQITIGSLVLSLKRDCAALALLDEQETKELRNIFCYIENLLKIRLGADKINYLALMMIDNQVHFHIIPRYNKTIIINGKEYFDEKWPNPPDISLNISLSENEMLLLNEKLKL